MATINGHSETRLADRRRPATQGDEESRIPKDLADDTTRAQSSSGAKQSPRINGVQLGQQSDISSRRIITQEAQDYLTARPALLARTKSDFGPRSKDGLAPSFRRQTGAY